MGTHTTRGYSSLDAVRSRPLPFFPSRLWLLLSLPLPPLLVLLLVLPLPFGALRSAACFVADIVDFSENALKSEVCENTRDAVPDSSTPQFQDTLPPVRCADCVLRRVASSCEDRVGETQHRGLGS